MRILCYLVLLLTFGIASAQTATILQGDYISNVFGNSNFVLNPNAQTSNCTTSGTITCANVTVSNASITRSTTTPLVARTEFLMTTSTATGYADWALRTFDQGMKGQNCEARFTYKGFTVGTTTAQIHQGSNVVAQLTLTPSATDPRIASINFPCGDLSAVTKFRLQQATASLTGTNEIGGIYVGLATNMANVAQAEFVGSLTWATGSDSNQLSGTSYAAFGAFTAAPTVVGSITSPSNAPAFTIPSFKPGNYRVVLTGQCMSFASSTTDTSASYRLTDGSTQFGTAFVVRNLNPTAGANIGSANPCGSFDFQYTGATISKTFQVEGAVAVSGTTMRLERSSLTGFQISVYRFPSSSELVVTPERQNVFGGVQYAGSSDFSANATGTDVKINTTNFGSPSGFGKAQVTSLTDCGLVANDVGFCLKNVPPGTYLFNSNVQVGAGYSFGTAGATVCTGNAVVAGSSLSATRIASTFTTVNIAGDEGWTILPSGIVTIPSFQSTLAVYLTYSKANALGRCVFRSSPTAAFFSTPSFSLTPLDQPTNSALYVQGPVLSGQTGSVLPAGYIGETITSTSSSTGTFANGVVTQNVGSLTLTPGTWLVSAHIQFVVAGSFNFNTLSISTISGSFDDAAGTQPQAATAGAYNSIGSLTRVIRVTSNTPVYAVTKTWIPSGTSTYQNMSFSAVRIGSN